MVALARNPAPENPRTAAKNRVRDFFPPAGLAPEKALPKPLERNGKKRLAVRNRVRRRFWGKDLSGSLGGAGGVGGLLMLTDSGEDYLASYDGNGNLMALTKASDGTMAAMYEYSPYGKLLRAEGPYALEDPFRFSTKYRDKETGLYNYGLRYYDPEQGRFINRDPIEEKGGLNLYMFADNDPVNNFDVLGLRTATLKDGIDLDEYDIRFVFTEGHDKFTIYWTHIPTGVSNAITDLTAINIPRSNDSGGDNDWPVFDEPASGGDEPDWGSDIGYSGGGGGGFAVAMFLPTAAIVSQISDFSKGGPRLPDKNDFVGPLYPDGSKTLVEALDNGWRPETKFSWKAKSGAEEDLLEAQRLWEGSLTVRLPNGSLPQGVKDMIYLMENGKNITIHVGSGARGSVYEPDNILDGVTDGVGTGGKIFYYPGSTGPFRDGVLEDPMSTLIHEVAHAAAGLQGKLKNIQMYEELRAAGIENEFRYARGIEQRQKLYRTLDPRVPPQEYLIKQYP